MGALENEQITETTKVQKHLIEAMAATKAYSDGAPADSSIATRIDGVVIWMAVSHTALSELATTAETRSFASELTVKSLEDDAAVAAVLPDNLGAAERATITKGREIIEENSRRLIEVCRFDRALALKVWSQHRTALQALVSAKDYTGLKEAVMKMIDIVLGEIPVVGTIKDIIDVFSAFDAKAQKIQTAIEIEQFYMITAKAYMLWAVTAHWQIHRLRGTRLSDAELYEQVEKEVLERYATLNAASRKPRNKSL